MSQKAFLGIIDFALSWRYPSFHDSVRRDGMVAKMVDAERVQETVEAESVDKEKGDGPYEHQITLSLQNFSFVIERCQSLACGLCSRHAMRRTSCTKKSFLYRPTTLNHIIHVFTRLYVSIWRAAVRRRYLIWQSEIWKKLEKIVKST